jgi:glycosyltransferase involved in cell wall biosynthesis
MTLTGYGLQTSLFAPRMRDLGYDVSINAPMSLTTSPISWNGINIYGAAGDPLGNDLLGSRVARFDILFTLCDLFGLMVCAPQLAGRKIVHWMPVDCEPMGERDIATLRTTGGIPLCMSKFGTEQIRREGFDPIYVPHGVDTEIFKPDPETGRAYREGLGISPETFVVGMVCVNKPDSRKGIDQQMQAFSIFHKKHPDSLLLMHTGQKGGWDLDKISLNLGIHNAVKYTDQYALVSQMTSPESMAVMFNAMDILSICSEGEGFGLPALDAQACGIPVVATDFSATRELCNSGWLVGGQKHWVGGHESWWMTPSVNEIANRYEEAYANRDNQLIKDNARLFALDYDVNTVMEKYFKPAMAECESRWA